MKKRIVFLAYVIIFFLVISKDVFACKGTQVLYEDNFATLDPAWGTLSPNLSINNGKMIVQPDVNKSFTVINQGNILEDIDVCVNVILAKSDDPAWGASAGLIFWAKDYSDYYYLLVSGNGWFSVNRWVNQRSLRPVPWRENAVIKKGVGQTNQLRVVTKGNQATVYINDTEVISFTGQPAQGGSFIGLTANSPEKSQDVWEFSDLKVTKP